MTALSQHHLAIVIPAFKPDFLARALECLLKQTDQRRVEWDRVDPRHHGVTEDRRVMPRKGHLLRITL